MMGQEENPQGTPPSTTGVQRESTITTQYDTLIHNNRKLNFFLLSSITNILCDANVNASHQHSVCCVMPYPDYSLPDYIFLATKLLIIYNCARVKIKI